MVSTTSEKQLFLFGFELDVFKRQCAKYARLNCKRMIRLFFSSIIESAQRECTAEMAAQIQDLSENYMQIIVLDLAKLNRTFDEKVEKYLSIPTYVTVHGLGVGQLPAVCDSGGGDAEENALNGHIIELETVHKQQAIFLQKLRAELEFYSTVMDVQGEIDDGLCLLVEKYMQNSDNELDACILEQLNNMLALEDRNAEIES